MRRKIIGLLLFVAGLSTTLFAQANLNQPIPADPNVKVGKLQNGLTYYIRKNSKPENKVEFRLAVNAGSVMERDDQQGYAHFLEHMAFNGTKNFKKNELISYLQSIGVEFGAHLNAYTSFDETVYMLSVPTEKKELLDKGLLVMQDWASSITLDPEEVKREQGVVLEELRLGKGADQRMRDRYFPYLFYGSQYANRLPIGKKELLENVNYTALKDFYEEWYRPDLMALILVGDINVDEIEAKIKANFSGINAKRPAKPRPNFEIPDHQETFVAIETDKEAQLTLAQILFKKPPVKVTTLADYRQSIVNSFFGGMLSLRLDEIRQSPNPPFIFAGMGFGGFTRNKGAYSMVGATTPENLKQTISTLLLENRRVKQFGFTQAELDRQKENYLKSLENIYKEREKTESRWIVGQYVNNFLTKTVSPGVEFDYQFGKSIVPTITLAEINALAKQTTSDENRVAIVTGLDKEGVKYPTKDEILNLMKEAETANLKPYTETVVTEPLVADLPVKTALVEEKKNDKFGITAWTLSNGIKVVLKPTDFKADEIIMRGFSPGGLSLVSNEKALSGSFVSGIISESGLKDLSKVQLNKMLAGKRATVSLSIGNLFEYVNGNTNPQDFETMLQLLYLKFTNVNFQKPVFDSYITQQKMFLPSLLANPETYFYEEIDKIISAGNPRNFSQLDPKVLEKVNFEEVKTIYQDRFSDASDFTFVFVGSFENEKIKPLILKYLGSLPSKNRKEEGKDLGFRPFRGKIEKVFKKGLEQKSMVDIGFGGIAEYSLDENRSLTALGELLTIKLTEILREEKAGVYGVNAGGGISKIPYQRYSFSISFPCGPENVDSLVKAALDEIRKIQNGQFDEKDVAKVIESRLVRIREDYKQNWFWYSMIDNELTDGDPLLTQEESEKRIRAITKEDIQRAAQKYLKIDERQQFILMPEDKK